MRSYMHSNFLFHTDSKYKKRDANDKNTEH